MVAAPDNKDWLTGCVPLAQFSSSLVVGVLNLTADSFSDGGKFLDQQVALDHANGMVEAGAGLIELGAESTRPGSHPVDPSEQWLRIEPVLKPLVDAGHQVAVDTSHPEVMDKSLTAGCTVINDVRGFSHPEALSVVASHRKAAVVIMHMQGEPATMQVQPKYEDVVGEVIAYLHQRTLAAIAAGIAREAILWDPGFGFGKTMHHNVILCQQLPKLLAAAPTQLMVGISRKSIFKDLLALPVDQRQHATLIANSMLYLQGARVFRVHDVAEHVQMCKLLEVLQTND